MEIICVSIAVVSLCCLRGLFVATQVSLRQQRWGTLKISPLSPEPHWAVQQLLRHPERTERMLRFNVQFVTLISGGLGLLLLYPLHAYTQSPYFSLEILLGVGAIAVYYLIGDCLPRRLALVTAPKSLCWTAWPVLVTAALTLPLRYGIEALGGLVLRLESNLPFRDDALRREAVDKTAADASPIIRQIVANVFRFQELTLQDVLLPRHQIQYFNLRDSIEANLDLARETGHTRFPLCDEDLDNCVGIVHIKDLFRYRGDLKQLDSYKAVKRKIIRLPLDKPLEATLQALLSWKVHMALVTDEFGGTIGVITLERLLEELVGSIQDEFDHEEANIVSLSGNAYRVLGLTPLHDLEETLGVTMDKEEIATFGGLITAELGRIPKQHERLELNGMQVLIEEVDDKRVIATKVILTENNEAVGSVSL